MGGGSLGGAGVAYFTDDGVWIRLDGYASSDETLFPLSVFAHSYSLPIHRLLAIRDGLPCRPVTTTTTPDGLGVRRRRRHPHQQHGKEPQAGSESSRRVGARSVVPVFERAWAGARGGFGDGEEDLLDFEWGWRAVLDWRAFARDVVARDGVVESDVFQGGEA